jgi:hypothetical protein
MVIAFSTQQICTSRYEEATNTKMGIGRDVEREKMNVLTASFVSAIV